MNPEKLRVINENIRAEIRRNGDALFHLQKELDEVTNAATQYINTPLGTLREIRVRSVQRIINILLEELEYLTHQQLVYDEGQTEDKTDEGGGGGGAPDDNDSRAGRV